jgi:hypothetical protein
VRLAISVRHVRNGRFHSFGHFNFVTFNGSLALDTETDLTIEGEIKDGPAQE